MLKSEDETSIFGVFTAKSFWQCMGCSYETNWVNIILAVIRNLVILLPFALDFKGQEHVFAG